MEIVPNACGARLILCDVEFDTQSPCAPKVTLTEYPIIAFEPDGKRFIPLTLAGRVPFWGELRVSVVGAFVYGITAGGGVELADGRRCSTQAELEHEIIETVRERVCEVRREKGWPEDRMPRPPARIEEGNRR